MTKQKQTEHKRKKWLRFTIITLTLLLAIGCVFCTDIFTVGETITKDLFTKVKDFYCNGLFYLLGGLDLIFMAVYAKDDKKFAVFKAAGIAVVGVFIGLHLIGLVKTTLTGIVSKYDSTTNTTVEYTGNTNTDGDTGSIE